MTDTLDPATCLHEHIRITYSDERQQKGTCLDCGSGLIRDLDPLIPPNWRITP